MENHATSDSAWIDELLDEDTSPAGDSGGATERRAFDEAMEAARDAASAVNELDKFWRIGKRSDAEARALAALIDATARYYSQITHVGVNYDLRIGLLRHRNGPGDEATAKNLERFRGRKLDELFSEMESHLKIDREHRLACWLLKKTKTIHIAKQFAGGGVESL